MKNSIHRRTFLKATAAGAAMVTPAFLPDLYAADNEIKVAGIHDRPVASTYIAAR